MAEKVGEIYYDCTLDTKGLIDGGRVVNREVDRASAAFNKITQAVKLYAAALALVKSAQMADDTRLLAARVEVAAGSLEKAAAAMGQLQRISARTQTDLAANVSVFTRLNASLVQMGGNQGDTLRITELLGMAIKVSGASAAEASSAMTQFAQALGSGKLAGDELRSLLENAPYLMQQLAAGIGVPVGALKQLGEEGKLTADVVTEALSKAAGKIEEDFRRLPQTLGAAMDVTADAAKRANLAFDALTGTSAALTGATQGVGKVLDILAQQFDAATGEAQRLGRSKAAETWSDRTVLALSYVADAADVVWQTISVLGRNVSFVFETLGSQIGGVAAMAKQAAQGNLTAARAIWDEMSRDDAKRRAELDAKDQETLRGRLLAGQKIRQQIAALEMTPAPDRMDAMGSGTGAPSKLRPPAGGADTPGNKAKFDSIGYLQDLRARTVDAYAQIDIVEQEALRKNAELQAQGRISREQAAEAVLLIEADAAHKRREISLREIEDRRQLIEDAGQQEIAQRERLAAEQRKGQEFAAGLIAGDDPIARLAFEQQSKLETLRDYAERGLILEQEYAAARIALEEQTSARLAEIIRKQRDEQAAQQAGQLQAYGNLFGSMADLTKAFAGKQNTAYKVLFAASKAFAIAESIIKIQQGIANAAALPFPANLGAMASVVSATAGIISTIKGVNYGGGRQYGGPAAAGSLYRVNETGRPEMFTAANGAQYMLPTTGGRVTPADQVGGGAHVEVRVHNYAGADVQVTPSQDGRVVDIAVRRAKAEIASDIANNTGEVWRSLRGASNVQPRQG